MKKRVWVLSFLLVFTLIFQVSCTQNMSVQSTTKSDFVLNTFATIIVYGEIEENVLEEAFNLCRFYENKFSRTISASDVGKINSGETVGVDKSTLEVLEISKYYNEKSGGVFDISLGKVVDLWNESFENGKIPEKTVVENIVNNTGMENFEIKNGEVRVLNEYTNIDLGGVAKGYIADKLKEFLLEKNVKAGIINLGGNVLTFEENDRKTRNIGIKNPKLNSAEGIDEELIGYVKVNNKSVVTSGMYERFKVIEGEVFHHIINPKTGFPVDSDLESVTIITDKSVDGDALSTTVFVLGLEDGIKFIESLENVGAILVSKDGEKCSTGNNFEFIESK